MWDKSAKETPQVAPKTESVPSTVTIVPAISMAVTGAEVEVEAGVRARDGVKAEVEAELGIKVGVMEEEEDAKLDDDAADWEE